MRRSTLLLFFLFLFLALAPAEPRAHALLLGSDPKDGEVLKDPIEAVVLNFNETIVPVDVRVLDAAGSAITGMRDVRVRDSEMRIILPPEMPKGAYLVTYRVRSSDSHPVAGSFYFSLGYAIDRLPMPPNTHALEDAWRTTDWALRTLNFATLAATCGGALFAVFVAGGASRWLRRYVLVSAGLTALTAAFDVGVHGALLALTPFGEFFSARPWQVGGETSLAPAAAIAIGGVVLIALSIRRIARPFFQVTAVLGAAIVAASLTATGHVGGADPAWLATSSLGLHVLTVSFWIGALWPLLRVIVAAPQDAPRALARFSIFAVPNVALLALSGLTVTYLQVREFGALVTTDYGRMLLIKLALVAGLAALATYNRQRLLGRLKIDRDRTLTIFRRTIHVELLLAFLIFGVTAGLGFATPPRAGGMDAAHHHHEAPEGAGIAAEAVSGAYKANLAVMPGRAGLNTLELMVHDVKGMPIKSHEVTAEITKDDQGIEAFPRTAEAITGDRYQFAFVPMPYSGKWQVRVDVLVSDFEKAIFRFEVEIP
jgi:copper transport protein